MFKDNSEVFATVAALGIVGGLAGNVIGAAFQSRGGKAQADAAVLAARIAGEAQRLAALHTDRPKDIAEFIQAAAPVQAGDAFAQGSRLILGSRWTALCCGAVRTV
ncbi:hypothetical protein [Streptomyces sp. NPDC060035]|uniref:hypothetical protein n=1 Tax=Streptomyces sp. NPDC060035 TaxID=3347044 RepID=UPI0036B77A7E